MEKKNAVKIAKYILDLFYEGNQIYKSKYYDAGMVCAAPDITGRYDIKISGLDCRVCMDRQDEKFLMGDCTVTYHIRDNIKKGVFCQYSMLFQQRDGSIFLTALHISETAGKEFCLTDVAEHTYCLREADILYLESGHNRIYWHMGKKIIEVTGYLQNTEKALPDNFIRIHKSFIVNVLHVERIMRCCLELSNGEILQIPVKKYTEVRKKIIATKVNL